MFAKDKSCWLCKGNVFAYDNFEALSQPDLSPEMFRITDANYGKSLPRFKCVMCGFIQCDVSFELIEFYNLMEDVEYEQGLIARKKQAIKLISKTGITQNKKWLDVGCGVGILVSAASEMGIYAQGVEPSKKLADNAKNNGLNVFHGTLDTLNFNNSSFDIVSLIDVIEHVDNPNEIIAQCVRLLKPGGRLLISTPDSQSIFAKILKSNWWHVRVAHVGYFNKQNLNSLLLNHSIQPVKWFRPRWYFEIGYLYNRIRAFLPFLPNLSKPKTLLDAVIPLNLGDSWAVIGELREI